ncbi:hypothetical protein NUH88_20195 [Nisaea acidiphila]|uniref:Uncharacterized protein n=1 Tax=Nisaea acidiphila TaxID=1862145 RepID=A0A9J7AS63_9PROT|nr:hypothetical protein [Nisaea acidiphila]UUX49706.1 hypothetical protein NUH88_20195 [Nisaea acidiphila]
MALGPINNFPLVPVPTGERQVPAQPNGADGRSARAEELDPATSRFAQELRGSDPRADQQNGRQRQNAIPLEEISADLPRGSILDITV